MPLAADLKFNLVPQPSKVLPVEGRFHLNAGTPIRVDSSARASNGAAEFLKLQLGRAKAAEIGPVSGSTPAIHFRSSTQEFGGEGYALNIDPNTVSIEACAAAGWFYGVQTLLQLLPPSVLANTESPAESTLPCVRIIDRPRFSWRGLMLDVSRHFMPVEGILRLLDNMAAHKLNTFHWHLTDDQGWRIQSDRYPRLTEIGAWRRGADGELSIGDNAPLKEPQGTYGGFYTHDDVRKIVAHAADLHIRVVPEIEMPGHAQAALAAYPELSCTGQKLEPATRTGIIKDVYCAGNEATFDFLQGVLEEIIPLFPGQYLHIGGDECPKDRWRNCPKCQARIKGEGLKDEHELQSYLVRRMEKFLAAHDKRLIGWDEILEGGLAPSATVMSWRGTEGGITAAKAGHDAIMTPHGHCYLDYPQAATGEPSAIGRPVLSLEQTYSYEPIPGELNAQEAKYIIGVQGNVWTEYMLDIQHVEYMIWPRAAAIAEIGWSQPKAKDFNDFRRRALANEPRLTASGSNFRPIDRNA